MSTEFRLPPLHIQYLKVLFPNLDFGRVRYMVGIPEIIKAPDASTQGAITQQIGSNQQAIYFRESWFEPRPGSLYGSLLCTTEGFLTLVHEHVHVQQIQNSIGGGRILGSWIFNYVTCVVASFSVVGSCFEKEAYDFANRDYPSPGKVTPPAGKVRQGLDDLVNAINKANPPPAPQVDSSAAPFTCEEPFSQFGFPSPSVPFTSPGPNSPGWQDWVNSHLGMIKDQAGCDLNACLAGTVPVVGWLWDAVAIIVGLLVGFATLGGTNIGTLIGVAIGGFLGFVFTGGLGALGGLLFGGGVAVAVGLAGLFLSLLGGILGAVFGAALGGFLGGLLSDLIDLIFGGDSGGQLNIDVSRNQGASYGEKATFERSREQIALAIDQDIIAIGWTGLDAQVNVVTIKTQPPPPAGTKPPTVKKSFEQVNHCGPALAWGDPPPGSAQRPLFVLWQGTDGRLNTKLSPDDGQNWGPTQTIPEPHLPSDFTPGMTFLNGALYVAWQGAGATDVLSIWGSTDGGATFPPALRFFSSVHAMSTSTAALTTDGTNVFLAWSDGDPNLFLYLMTLAPQADKSLTMISITDVQINGVKPRVGSPGHGNAKHGPALTFDVTTWQLALSWVDAENQIHVAYSPDGAAWGGEVVLPGESSRGNSGPGIAFGQQVYLLAWTGQG
jgi:hypothetical protein